MKNILIRSIIIVSLFGIINQLHAQNDSELKKHRMGGFCEFFVGPAYFKSQSMTDYLRRSNVLGSRYSPSGWGNTMGFEINKVMDRCVGGVGVFSIGTLENSTNRGRAAIKVNGAYAKFGYKFLERPSLFMMIYANLGGFAYTIQLSNLSDTAFINFNQNAPVAPARKRNYFTHGGLIDLGIAIKTIPLIHENPKMKDYKQAFLLGIDVGVFAGMPMTEWTNKNYVVDGPPNVDYLLSPYIRFTLGFGAFKN